MTKNIVVQLNVDCRMCDLCDSLDPPLLSRVVEVVKFLGVRGLALRGDSHIIGNSDKGNFLGSMELIGKFDPFLADHIARFGNPRSGYPSYLSHATMEEIVSILGNELRENIVASIRVKVLFHYC